jgi:hypothetical protein
MYLNAVATIALMFVTAGCSRPRPSLSSDEIKSCIAKGGYASRGGFGEPFCQFHYADGGKACSGKTDCEGDCIYQLGNGNPEVKPGTPVKGECASERSMFGCYGLVENGRTQGGGCTD